MPASIHGIKPSTIVICFGFERNRIIVENMASYFALICCRLANAVFTRALPAAAVSPCSSRWSIRSLAVCEE